MPRHKALMKSGGASRVWRCACKGECWSQWVCNMCVVYVHAANPQITLSFVLHYPDFIQPTILRLMLTSQFIFYLLHTNHSMSLLAISLHFSIYFLNTGIIKLFIWSDYYFFFRFSVAWRLHGIMKIRRKCEAMSYDTGLDLQRQVQDW